MGFSVNEAGREKPREFYRTGKPQQLGQGEIQKPRLPFAFALPGSAPQGWQVQLRPWQRITVAAFFGWTIPFNGKIDEDDLNLLVLLLSIVRGTPIPIDYLTTTIRKSEGTLELIRQSGSSQLELAVLVESINDDVACRSFVPVDS